MSAALCCCSEERPVKHSISILFSICAVLGVIVLPQENRARQLLLSVSASRQVESFYIVADAAEFYAEQNSGIYSPNTAGLQGNLPGGRLLMNPYTLADTEPVDGAAATPGQIGYIPVVQGGWNVGFVLTAFGRYAEILSISRYPDADADNMPDPLEPE
jgi:hypothetical protein